MGTILTHSGLAEAIGVNPGQLTNWRKAGMPCVANDTHKGGTITYDLADVFRWVRDTGRHQDAEAEGALVPAMETAKLSRSRRLKVDLDRRVKAGELVSARMVQRAVFPVVRALRDGLLAIPDRLASILAATSEEHVVHAKMLGEIRATLESSERELLAVAENLTTAPQDGEGDGADDSGGDDE